MTGGRLKRVAKYLGDETFCFTYGMESETVDIGQTLEISQRAKNNCDRHCRKTSGGGSELWIFLIIRFLGF